MFLIVVIDTPLLVLRQVPRAAQPLTSMTYTARWVWSLPRGDFAFPLADLARDGVIGDEQIALLAHIIRADENDYMRKVTFDQNKKSVQREYRRVGGPRINWYNATLKNIRLWVSGACT